MSPDTSQPQTERLRERLALTLARVIDTEQKAPYAEDYEQADAVLREISAWLDHRADARLEEGVRASHEAWQQNRHDAGLIGLHASEESTGYRLSASALREEARRG